ncbi:hypothetical protein IMG5_184360 [Ichthyophthirius multifiliis]|uniref:Endonuclease/exonuclease/phosphatase domain-containing protein n=1 Tax=Ichthyophthirius multifiliis TaxID=5932 RepID=G0R3B5_ICHMU|nr:hypothetical protein IMG5_184360 [Ichthyophthirius multifiliis]EGR28034.1 hypothetical protein IMG5_184360 [Ichthyophthirius multifiliis]|eukprot:XP_004027379.1 hypothetical protein IMG5_184360 [Ichthyophthirius multifiliis]
MDFNNDNILLCGDFNMKPIEKGYNFLKSLKFQSIYEFIHQNEPIITFPTGLQAPHMDTDPEGCYDYIFWKGKNIIPNNIFIIGDQCLDSDKTIYPSDHMGLTAILDIQF